MLCKRRTYPTRPGTIGLLLFVVFLAPLGAVNMVRIANIPPALEWTTFPGGDGDHDLMRECYGLIRETLYAIEYQGNGVFQSQRLRYEPYRVFGYGDGDGDGLSELLICHGAGNVVIFESRAPDSLPGDSVWGVTPLPYIPSISFPQYVDLDRDGHQEIALAIEGHGIWLYENVGDNDYRLSAVLDDTGRIPTGTFCVGDFDRDSLMELATGNGDSDIFIFEATGPDNEFAISALLDIETIENYWVASGRDMDLDGWPEFVVVGRGTGGGWVMVFEASAHAQYSMVWHEVRHDFNWFSEHPISVGDVDGDSAEEFILPNGNGAVVLFKATAQHVWQQVWYYDQAYSAARLFDINSDGRAEVILNGPDGVEIWEDTTGLAGAAIPKPPSWVRSIAVTPTVSRRGWPAIFTGIPGETVIEVHDLAGRPVRTQALAKGPSWTWNLRDQAGNVVPAGTYFAVIRSSERLASLKLFVVK